MRRIAGLILMVMVAACGQSDLEMVKGGTMTGYETTTIGKAFDRSFDAGTWQAFKTDKGQRVVEFNGKE